MYPRIVLMQQTGAHHPIQSRRRYYSTQCTDITTHRCPPPHIVQEEVLQHTLTRRTPYCAHTGDVREDRARIGVAHHAAKSRAAVILSSSSRAAVPHVRRRRWPSFGWLARGRRTARPARRRRRRERTRVEGSLRGAAGGGGGGGGGGGVASAACAGECAAAVGCGGGPPGAPTLIAFQGPL